MRTHGYVTVAFTEGAYVSPVPFQRGFDFFRRDVDTSSLDIAEYRTYSTGAGVRFGIPVTEYDTVNIGFTGERTGSNHCTFTDVRTVQNDGTHAD